MRAALPLAAALIAACGPDAGDTRPDVALIVIDTLRADALSCYGNPRDTTPHLDALARQGVLFEEVFAHAPNTVPSHASLFTGLHPSEHAASNFDRQDRGPAALDGAFDTLAERFAAEGWQTAAFTDGVVLGDRWNLLQGFEHTATDTAGVAAKVDQALEFLGERRDGRPLFLFLHTYQVHMPYTAPEPFASRYDAGYDGILRATDRAIRDTWIERGELPPFSLLKDRESFTDRDVEHLVALYHGELAYTDSELARLWPALEGFVLAVTSDHGEEFGEHGWIGHAQLHRETLHVPLIVRAPGAGPAGRRVAGRVGLIDLHALLLRAAGLDAPPEAQDLLAAARTGAADPRAHFAERNDRLHLGPEAPHFRAVRWGERALLERLDPAGARRLAYDLQLDPGEQQPLDGAPADLRELLDAHGTRQDLRRVQRLGADTATFPPLDAATLARLRALGYGPDGRDR